jgi:hypothetical protein
LLLKTIYRNDEEAMLYTVANPSYKIQTTSWKKVGARHTFEIVGEECVLARCDSSPSANKTTVSTTT